MCKITLHNFFFLDAEKLRIFQLYEMQNGVKNFSEVCTFLIELQLHEKKFIFLMVKIFSLWSHARTRLERLSVLRYWNNSFIVWLVLLKDPKDSEEALSILQKQYAHKRTNGYS